ncbi:class III extradiol ring-cleavage dioxygenase [Utexia brackfieldae]|uniref:DODA-type extradiol aromatic ring-opening family dioxygenase n=1 Tax=Utexia brackfieldae TaxID=3074108 RepID=UPI00370DADB2
MERLPVVFVTHGSPMLAIEPGDSGPLLAQLGDELLKKSIKAIAVISAHWITKQRPFITAAQSPETIHDFGGFPELLYRLSYPASGASDIAKLVQDILLKQGIDADLDPKRGLDHGAWIPLQYLFPEANIPVIQISMPWPMTELQALTFGELLKPLRDQGILLIASGSMTHNLYDVGENNGHEKSYIAPFVSWVRDALKKHNLSLMQNYRQLAPFAVQAHPTEEHFLPLLIALGASEKGEPITTLSAGTTYQALAMDNYIFG